MSRPFAFDDVVGQDDAKLALLLAAVDPLLGGVLLRGEKGSAKTTLARGLAAVLGDAPFVELPLGATEDRVVGTIDVAAALGGGEVRFRPGLLAEADGGVLYVDEINLLADHLVDVLLDVAVSGQNRVERDGLSHRHPARFVLIGSMNPEEGELRPQLLDRFGLCVEVTAPIAVDLRVKAVRRRLAHDGAALRPVSSPDPAAGPSPVSRSAQAAGRARPAALGSEVLLAASGLAVEVGAEGLRADLALCRAAAATAGLEGRPLASLEDLRRVAPLVLAHRARRRPFDPPALAPQHLADALDRALDPSDPGAHGHRQHQPDPDRGADRGSDSGHDASRTGDGDGGGGGGPRGDAPMVLGPALRSPAPPPPSLVEGDRGRFLRSVPAYQAPGAPIAVVATARAIADRGSAAEHPGAPTNDDLRVAVRAEPARRLIVLCVDLSGSMGAEDRVRAATGTALGLLADAYQRRHRVAVVAFAGDGAQVVLHPTSSVEVARNRLRELRTGGKTPLAHGIRAGLDVATARHPATGPAGDQPLLVLLSDGRATGEAGALTAALDAAVEVRRRGIASLVVDCETGPRPLGLAARLADAMGAVHVPASDLEPTELAAAIRALADR